jgi:ABC-type sugar transport system ATPase subunit
MAGGLRKKFPGVIALDDVSVDFAAGSVTAVLGENGAGKSTLMSILAGLQRPDAGTVTIHGRPVRSFTPHALLHDHRVALVPQEIALCRDRTVAENVLLGREPGRFPARQQMVTETRRLLELIEADIDPRQLTGRLTVAELQQVIIARALARECRILILDEPTATLTGAEASRLFTLLGQLREAGTTVIYVSHRIPEIFQICERIHVLRDGRAVADFRIADVDPPAVIAAMVGRDVSDRPAIDARPSGAAMLTVAGLTGARFSDVSFSVAAGEVLGVAGLPDSGRSELVAALFGVTRATGVIRLAGQPLTLRSPKDAIGAGIGYVPAERRSQGLFPAMSVADNLTILDLDSVTRFGIVRRRALRRMAAERLEQYDVRGQSRGRIGGLSGGNQQKVILARWMARQPRLLLLDDPTRGIDVRAKSRIHQYVADAAASGVAVVMSSSDLPELLRTCHRLVVMARGRIAGIVEAASASEQSVMALATAATDQRSGDHPLGRATQ